MTAPQPRYTAGDLFRHLTAELGALADMADAVQHAAMDVAAGHPAQPEVRARVVVGLQGLDALTQRLRDLQRLAEAGRDLPLSRLTLKPDAVRSALRLNSLADRLITGEERPPPEDEFLL